jgi:hypothetical protein
MNSVGQQTRVGLIGHGTPAIRSSRIVFHSAAAMDGWRASGRK